ncbi:hypothetical protein HPB50_016654 [Hyalomma asiaticum]|uniref:Uncharacterized protein n=1 Tax=Hyalomma asiaticum TaxID=266040 RepID=A0ACB7TIV6_HYAAI|nr:hypothetical protein HPB50_016654 [Hyalomma asiaticum]
MSPRSTLYRHAEDSQTSTHSARKVITAPQVLYTCSHSHASARPSQERRGATGQGSEARKQALLSKESRSRIFERQAVLPIGSTQSGLATQKGLSDAGKRGVTATRAINTAPSRASAAPVVGAFSAAARKLAGIITLGKASIAALNKGGSAERKRTPSSFGCQHSAIQRYACPILKACRRSGLGLTAAM